MNDDVYVNGYVNVNITGGTMYPHLLQELVNQRMAESRAIAEACWQHPSAPPRTKLRARAGWTLVTVGLRLALEPSGRVVPRPRPSGV